MLSEFLDKLNSLTAARKTPVVVRELSNDNTVTLAIDGELVSHYCPPTPRVNRLDSIADLCDAIRRFAVDEAKAAAWVEPTSVVVILDETAKEAEQDRLVMRLSLNDAFETLRNLQNKWLTQKQAVNVLRHDLAGCQLGPDNLLASIRKLKFATKSEATGEFTNTSAALGRSVESQVSGEIELPEKFAVTFHPYPALNGEFPSLEVSVFCSLFTDPGEGTLRFAALPGEFDRCKREAAEEIKESIAENSAVDVFLGT